MKLGSKNLFHLTPAAAAEKILHRAKAPSARHHTPPRASRRHRHMKTSVFLLSQVEPVLNEILRPELEPRIDAFKACVGEISGSVVGQKGSVRLGWSTIFSKRFRNLPRNCCSSPPFPEDLDHSHSITNCFKLRRYHLTKKQQTNELILALVPKKKALRVVTV